MHVASADTIVADIAEELELSPARASLYLDDLIDSSEADDDEFFDFDS